MDRKQSAKRQNPAVQSETQQATEIEILGLSPGVYKSLLKEGIETVEYLSVISNEDLLKIPGIGTKSRAEIHEKLALYLNDHLLLEQPQLIEVLGLSVRSYNCLKRAGINTVECLAAMSDDDLFLVRNLGAKSQAEIREKLATYLANHPLLTPPEPQEFSLSESPEFHKIEVLGLSLHAHHCLQQVGIDTVECLLATISGDDILKVPGVGIPMRTEIRDKLAAYLAKHPLPGQPRLIEVLGLSSRAHNRLLRARVDTVERLVAMSNAELLEAVPNVGITLLTEIRQKLTAYLADNPLPKQSELLELSSPQSLDLENTLQLDLLSSDDLPTTKAPISSDSITKTPKSLVPLKEDYFTVADIMDDWLAGLPQREQQVIRWRYGVDDEPLILEQVGERLGLTRERARQIQVKGVTKLKKLWNRRKVRYLTDCISKYFTQAGGVLNETQLQTMLEEEIEVGAVNLGGAIQLVLDLRREFSQIKKCKVWILKRIVGKKLVNELGNVQKYLIKIVEQNYVLIPVDDLLAQFKQTRYYKNRKKMLSNDFILACVYSHPDFVLNESGNIGLEKWSRRRLSEMILALRKIGEPAHFAVIAEQTNALLPHDQQTTPHNVHAQMQRLPDIFVRVGHGIYGLKEWDLHDDGSLANAAYRILQEVGQPLHIDIITEKVLKTWRANPTSVHAAIEIDERFIRIGRGLYCLKEQIQGDTCISSKADFGDLFGKKLARVQAELDRQQGPSELDTQAEVDKIRKLGTDFLT